MTLLHFVAAHEMRPRTSFWTETVLDRSGPFWTVLDRDRGHHSGPRPSGDRDRPELSASPRREGGGSRGACVPCLEAQPIYRLMLSSLTRARHGHVTSVKNWWET
eukprot:1177800-Prorocentrum_minimum.AAC.3